MRLYEPCVKRDSLECRVEIAEHEESVRWGLSVECKLGNGAGTMSGDSFFPHSPRVIYAHTPLVEVICQLRFPTILRIESGVPADFQDRLRTMYPLFRRVSGPALPDLPVEVSRMLGVMATKQVSYVFETEDLGHSVSLSPDSLSLTSRSYERWEAFSARLQPALDALVEVYRPAFFTRIGLRYQNAIVRSGLGVSGEPWSELISPSAIGPLSHTFGGARIEEAHSVLRARTADGSDGFLLQSGIGLDEGTKEEVYVIDVDLYTDKKVEVSDVSSYLARFNYRAGRAFRWCISDKLHGLLQPSELADV